MGWDSLLTGLGSRDPDFLIIDDPPPKDPPKPAEPDDSLRERLVYVAGDSERVIHELSVARGEDLDDIAERYGLKRHGT